MKNTKGKKITIIISIIVLILVIATFSGYYYVKSQLEPRDEASKDKMVVEIPAGSSISDISTILEDKKVINNASIFSFYVKYNNDTNLKAGNYELSPAMNTDEIVKKMQEGKTIAPEKLVIPEGYTLDQIAERIVSYQPKLKKADVIETMDNPDFIATMMDKYPETVTNDVLNKAIKHPLEGYLYPATYTFKETNATAETIIEEMVKATELNIAKYRDELTKQKMSVHHFLTMSSIIEKEATENVDRNKIASVFYNRLAKDMPLQTDPTVLYALGKHKSKTTYEDLKVDSPYNTYKNKGLPPGPISNSGSSSMEATLYPEKTDYLYFLANTKTGQVYFSKTLEEHNKLKEEHITKNN
ncbi:endolytic transglycosylase MltG [Listeria immobilis]|uniref:Endolytic murein transglycosylase n=1 Tax=Listeria immobilis TaxID=2713502 RepID=A0ABR6SXF4_9LIST|nr:endolytic transglycosylase MltG [Listeria immobilis]MBC1484498.1 endolytic transglycosylase MltG [Listeria immobilis]MBC1507506.1 endolytic transglycosylase MltG [Listeria immobilis]MBC1510371.1 endolytic transglycosylase MltG [Listeria immobilis]MBC1516081.1 endolytic transglycosylase MltG [Listeria immobilis]MBC6295882.1 endolytic transglycosylase MltG [Listeria immobilis]